MTEPDFTSAKQVSLFGQQLQRLVQFLGVSEAQMQMGQMRFEPNINVHITDQSGEVHKTAITEIKNLNSFSVLERATDYEIRRQIAQWVETGELGRKSTYGWDEASESTYWQRDKEEANDYRYFPDPDLVPVEVDDAWLGELKARIGELPAVRHKRYTEKLGLSEADATILASDRAIGDFFEEVVAAGAEPRRAVTLMETLREMSNEAGTRLSDLQVRPEHLGQIAALVADNKIAASKETARNLLGALAGTNASVEETAKRLGLIQVSDGSAIDEAIDALIAQNSKPLQDFKSGKQAALGALVGMVMKNGKGLNPKLVQEQLKKRFS